MRGIHFLASACPGAMMAGCGSDTAAPWTVAAVAKPAPAAPEVAVITDEAG